MTKGLTTGIMAPPKAMLEPTLVRISMTIMVKTRIKTGLRPSKMGLKMPVSQGSTPVDSLVRAVARGMVTAHIRMTGQLTALSECLMSLK